MENCNLFDYCHRLNYDEAVRRLEYWTTGVNVDQSRALSAVRILAGVLRNNRDNLYFEDSTNGN